MEQFASFETRWVEGPATAEPCAACKEPIYSTSWSFETLINGRVIDTPVVICNPCYELLKKEDGL